MACISPLARAGQVSSTHVREQLDPRSTAVSSPPRSANGHWKTRCVVSTAINDKQLHEQFATDPIKGESLTKTQESPGSCGSWRVVCLAVLLTLLLFLVLGTADGARFLPAYFVAACDTSLCSFQLSHKDQIQDGTLVGCNVLRASSVLLPRVVILR